MKLLNGPKILETIKITKIIGLYCVIKWFQGHCCHFWGLGYFLTILQVKKYFGHFKYINIFWSFYSFQENIGHFRGLEFFFFGSFYQFLVILASLEVLWASLVICGFRGILVFFFFGILGVFWSVSSFFGHSRGF